MTRIEYARETGKVKGKRGRWEGEWQGKREGKRVKEKGKVYLEILEQVVDTGIDTEGVEPEGEDTGLTFAFCIEIFHLAVAGRNQY